MEATSELNETIQLFKEVSKRMRKTMKQFLVVYSRSLKGDFCKLQIHEVQILAVNSDCIPLPRYSGALKMTLPEQSKDKPQHEE